MASEDAIKIFLAAKEGITKSTETIKELKLTQRIYYARLNELIDVGLVEKIDDVYQLTTLGTICYSLGEAFNATLNNRDQLDLANRLRKAKTISVEETQQILQAISSKGIIGSLGVSDVIHPIKMVDNYEDVVSELVLGIDGTTKSIYLASSYTDSKIMEAVLRAIKRNIRFSLLSGSGGDDLSKKLQLVRMIFAPQIVKDFLDLVSREEVRIKHADIPYSFCVLDEKVAMIELPNPSSKIFYVGFIIKNELLCHKLIKTFEDLYNEGKEDPVIDYLRKLRKVRDFI